jgi:glucose/mannose-6-phosphate isomerase
MDKMKVLIEGFSEQLRDALRIGHDAQVSAPEREIRNVLVAGMGGSGIGGSLVSALAQNELKVPISVSKSYDIPSFVDQHTLFIASSFSGNTEETISALEQALKAGAQCVAITSGGTIGKMAAQNQMDVINIPGESKSPRANIGYSAIQLLFMLHYKGLLSNRFIQEIEVCAMQLDAEEENLRLQAEKLANSMKGYLPILYADSKVFPVAVRIQQQINENGKHMAHANEFPEMNHNELVGWEHPAQVLKDSKVYFLRTAYDNPRVVARMRVCQDIFQEHAASVNEITARGDSFLGQCFYLIHLTDWVSYFLAAANDVDPFPVKAIDHLKSELAKV